MTKEELISILSKKTGIEREMVDIIINAFAAEVSTQLMNGETVHMRGLGHFGVKRTKQRVGRLIKKKKSLIIPEHDQPFFKVSEVLRQRIKIKSLKNDLPE